VILAGGAGPSSRTQSALQRAVDDAAKGAAPTGGQRGLPRAEPSPTPPGYTLPIAHDALKPGAQSANLKGGDNDNDTAGQRGTKLLGGAAGSGAAGSPAAGAAPSFAQVMATTTPSASSAAPSDAMIQAQPGSPEFALQASVQLTVFVREGVQHARLHLNPPEMGPVTVQIQLEGPSARIHLASENALTRQALQDALPQLASSLRESGLSLTGGGVFEQPRQTGQESNAAGQQAGNTGGNGPSAGSGRSGTVREGLGGQPGDESGLVANTIGRRGLVDLVA